MTAAGKITTTAITQQYNTKPGVRILVTQDPNTGALDLATRKTGAVAVLVTGYATVAGSRQCRYQFQTTAGTLTCAPSQTHWLARDKDKDALPAIAFDETTRAASVTERIDPEPSTEVDEIGTERFSAGWSDGEVTVIRDIRAGISGPFGEYPAATLEDAETVLRAHGYALSGPWSEHTNGHFAPLVRVPERSDPERPISGRRTVHALPLDNSADNAERGATEGAEWAATRTPAGLRQAIQARAATVAPGPYNDAYTAALRTRLDEIEAGESASDTAETFEHQASTNGSKTWRTVAVGLEAPDVDAYRAANAAGEGTSWRMLPEGDDRARAIAAKAAELTAARTRFNAECDRPIGGRSRTKQFGRRYDGKLRRAGELHRLVDRLAAELDALRRPVRVVPPLDLERLPFATHVRTDVGWYEVVKVNKKSVKVVVDPGWDDLIPIKRIKEIHERPVKSPPARTEAAIAAELAEVEATREEIPPGSRRPPIRAQEASDRYAKTLRRQLDEPYVSPWATV